MFNGILVIKKPSELPSGVIVLWSGSEESVPDGWVICDGENDTPDLTDRFVVGAGDTYAVDDTGGADAHTHGGGSLEFHMGGTSPNRSSKGTHRVDRSITGALPSFKPDSWYGVTGSTDHKPKYYALAYIMKT